MTAFWALEKPHLLRGGPQKEGLFAVIKVPLRQFTGHTVPLAHHVWPVSGLRRMLEVGAPIGVTCPAPKGLSLTTPV